MVAGEICGPVVGKDSAENRLLVPLRLGRSDFKAPDYTAHRPCDGLEDGGAQERSGQVFDRASE
jgi:hypothetical protein